MFKALKEKPNRASPTFYEKTFKLIGDVTYTDIYIYKNQKGNTLTGVVGFLFYSGSFYFLFASMILLCALANLIEFISFKISGSNLIFASLIGQIIAFRFIHFGYLPSQSYLLFGSIFLTLILVFILMKIFKR